MTGSDEKILGSWTIGVDLDYEDCVIRACVKPATRWKPSHIDGKLIPACEKHFNDPSITPRRWENARKRRERIIRELIGKRCYHCGKQATVRGYKNLTPALDSHAKELQSDVDSNLVWKCIDCSLADL